MIAEETREKEKLSVKICQQRKIIPSQATRVDELIDANNKIYHDFQQVVNLDQERKATASKISQIVLTSREEKDLIRH